MADYVLNNIDNIYNTSNEVLNRHTLNRNFQKLLQNDHKLNALYEEVQKEGNNILQYVDGNAYDKGQLVWFSGINLNNKMSLYLLESMFDGNANRPTLTRDQNNEYSFAKSGWKDKNEYTTIIENNLSAYIVQDFISKLNSYHEFDRDCHKFGQLTGSKSYNDTKLLLNDMTNIATERKKNFYPYFTGTMKADDVILDGSYRKWDNGLLEYDIFFKLSYVKQYYEHGSEYELLSCNTFRIADNDKDANAKYFSDDAARDIFLNKDVDSKSSKIESMMQVNRNDYVNTYSATIRFPEPFFNLNYMVFNSDIRCQERDTSKQTVDAGANAMTYANRKKDQITALYLMFPAKGIYDATKNGLVVNSFHCHIIGRWK